MSRDQLTYLLVGIAFGLLLGFGTYMVVFKNSDGVTGPASPQTVPAPAGPMAPTQTGQPAGGSAFMREFEELKTRLDQNPNDFAAVVELGDLTFRGGLWRESAEVYERALRLKPGDPDLLTVTARCYIQLGEPERALELLQEARSIDPSHAASLYNIALVQGLALREFEEAEETLRLLETEHPSIQGLAELRAAIDAARREEAP